MESGIEPGSINFFPLHSSIQFGHWVVTGDSWEAQHPFTAHFGLGDVTAVDSLEVRWPDGRVTRLANPPAGKYHILSASKAGLDKPGEGR